MFTLRGWEQLRDKNGEARPGAGGWSKPNMGAKTNFTRLACLVTEATALVVSQAKKYDLITAATAASWASAFQTFKVRIDLWLANHDNRS